MDVNGQLDSIVAGLKAIQADLAAREATARAEIEKVLVEKRKIDQMIRAAERTGVYAKPGAKTKSRSRAQDFSDETLEEYWQRLKVQTFDRFEDEPGTFAVADLAAKLGVHKSTSTRIIRNLRKQGRIRLVGERYAPDQKRGTGRPSPVYVINDG